MLHVFCTNHYNLPLMLTGERGLAHYLCCLFAFWCVCPIAFLLTLLFFLFCTLQFARGKIGERERFFLSSPNYMGLHTYLKDWVYLQNTSRNIIHIRSKYFTYMVSPHTHHKDHHRFQF